MNICNIPSSVNSSKSLYFGSNPTNNTQTKPSVNNKEKQKSNNLLAYALGGLALLAIGGISYKMTHRAPKTNELSNLNSKIEPAFISVKDYLENFAKNVKHWEQSNVEKELQYKTPLNYSSMDHLKNEDEKLFIHHTLAAKKLNLHDNIQFPKVIVLNNVTSKAKDVSKIFANSLDSSFSSTKFVEGKMKEFIGALEGFSSDAQKTYKEEKRHTFLNFDNSVEFLDELKLKENDQFKQKFDKLLNDNQSNKITYILPKKSAEKLNTDYLLKMDFDEKINTANITKDLEDVNQKMFEANMSEAMKIRNEFSEYVRTNTGLLIQDLLTDEAFVDVFFVKGEEKNLIEKGFEVLASKTNTVFQKLDCKDSLSDLPTKLIQLGEESEDLYNMTGKRTFLYLDNIEQKAELKEFLAHFNEKYHVIPIVNSNEVENLLGPAFDGQKTLEMKFYKTGEKVLDEALLKVQQRINENDFRHIDFGRLESFKREFFDLVEFERAGYKPQIKNGILLCGPSDLTRITADAIKNTASTNYVKITYDKNNPMKLISEMIKTAKNSEELFKTTKVRTLLELDGVDEMLIKPKNRDELKLVSGFKSFAEDLSEKYHTTILTRTDKSLDDFEPASIASNRLGVHIQVK